MTILAEVGFKIASITDIPTATAEHILTVAGLRDHFDDIVGSDTCRTRQLTRVANGSITWRTSEASAFEKRRARYLDDSPGERSNGRRVAGVDDIAHCAAA